MTNHLQKTRKVFYLSKDVVPALLQFEFTIDKNSNNNISIEKENCLHKTGPQDWKNKDEKNDKNLENENNRKCFRDIP